MIKEHLLTPFSGYLPDIYAAFNLLFLQRPSLALPLPKKAKEKTATD
jgi:hypothetical protein